MVCHSVELLKAKFIKELSVDNLPTSVKVVRLTDVVLSQIAQVTLCFIHYSEERLDTIASSS